MKNRGIRLLCALSVLWFGGCFKSVSYDTTYVMRPQVQTETSGSVESLGGVKAYAFAVDTTQWTVASYEDALAGIITSKRDASEKITHPTALATPFPASDAIPASVDWVQMPLDNPSMMIVAVDTEHKLYAYNQQAFSENLSPLYVAVTFQLWRVQYRTKFGSWCYVNDFYAPEQTGAYEYILKPLQQQVSGEEVTPLMGVKAYAYAVDTTAWKVASYDDALAGIITSKTDAQKQRTEPDFMAVVDDAGDGWLRILSDTMSVMVVAVDPEHKVYAYRQQPLRWYAPTEEGLTYRLWNKLYRYTENSWRIVNEAYAPQEPENPEEPETPEEPQNPEPQNYHRK